MGKFEFALILGLSDAGVPSVVKVFEGKDAKRQARDRAKLLKKQLAKRFWVQTLVGVDAVAA